MMKFVGREKRRGREDLPLLPTKVIKVTVVIFFLRTLLAIFTVSRGKHEKEDIIERGRVNKSHEKTFKM